MRVGCYGGESYTFDQIDKLILDIKDYEYYNESMKENILSTVQKFKEKYGIN